MTASIRDDLHKRRGFSLAGRPPSYVVAATMQINIIYFDCWSFDSILEIVQLAAVSSPVSIYMKLVAFLQAFG